jgi:SNF2 family DNA or RNA helicase
VRRCAPSCRRAGTQHGSFKLRPEQESGIAHMLALLGAGGVGGCLLCDDMGFGKTIEACAVADGLRATRALFLVPVGLVTGWRQTLADAFPARNIGWLNDKDGDEVVARLMVGSTWLVMTYGRFVSASARGIFAPYAQGAVELVVCDEAHKLSNDQTQVAEHVRQLGAQRVLLCTATPASNNLGELHALLDLASPGCAMDAAFWRKHVTEPLEARACGDVSAGQKIDGRKLTSLRGQFSRPSCWNQVSVRTTEVVPRPILRLWVSSLMIKIKGRGFVYN